MQYSMGERELLCSVVQCLKLNWEKCMVLQTLSSINTKCKVVDSDIAYRVVDLEGDDCGERDDLEGDEAGDVPVRGPEPLALRGQHGLVAHHRGVKHLRRGECT